MAGDDRARFCSQCQLHVYNLSALSRPEVEALILEKEGRLCVRYYQRADGTILTQDCPVGLQKRYQHRSTRLKKIAAVVTVMTAMGVFTATGYGMPTEVAGGVSLPNELYSPNKSMLENTSKAKPARTIGKPSINPDAPVSSPFDPPAPSDPSAGSQPDSWPDSLPIEQTPAPPSTTMGMIAPPPASPPEAPPEQINRENPTR